jgi:hypothetical protein
MSVRVFSAAVLLLGGLLQPALAADLATLFTTPEERALIDRNRYGSVQMQPEQQPAEDDNAGMAAEEVTYDRVTREYRITGITVSRDGPPTVWINSVAYEDGARLDDDSRVEVLAGDQVRVRITAPDGKRYYATSGETLEISILVPSRVKP